MRVALQPAFVLHTRHYRDTSALLDILTAEHGLVSLVAKGARRTVRGRSSGAILQPFIPLLISFSGRSELKTLTASEVAGQVVTLRGERLYSGLYLNELVLRLLHKNDAHLDLFVAFGDAIASLGGDRPVDKILRQFEFILLEQLGYSFDLGIDGHSGGAVCEDRWYHYHQEFGLVERRSSSGPDNPVFSGRDLLAIAAGEHNDSVRKTSKRLLRLVLSGHLGGKPLKSRELFRRTTVPGKTVGEDK